VLVSPTIFPSITRPKSSDRDAAQRSLGGVVAPADPVIVKRADGQAGCEQNSPFPRGLGMSRATGTLNAHQSFELGDAWCDRLASD
jgi:hypothetical protein